MVDTDSREHSSDDDSFYDCHSKFSFELDEFIVPHESSKISIVSPTILVELPVSDGSSLPVLIEPEQIEVLRDWLNAFVAVEFDQDVGPAVREIYPPGKSYLDDETLNIIAFFALPDSPYISFGDKVFGFKFAAKDSNGHKIDRYGFTLFRQQKDLSNRRGCSQRSLVIISEKDLHGLFTKAVQRLAPLYWQYGLPSLESACSQILQWPRNACDHVTLPFFGQSLSVDFRETPLSHSLSPLVDYRVYLKVLRVFPVSKLQTLWELTLLNQSIAVFTDCPELCSDLIFILKDLIRPIKYFGIIKPQLIVQDPESLLISRNPAYANRAMLVGATSPVFESFMKSIANVIDLTRNKSPISSFPALNQTPLKSNHDRFISHDSKWTDLVHSHLHQNDAVSVSNLVRDYFTKLTARFLKPLDAYLDIRQVDPKSCLGAPGAIEFDEFYPFLNGHSPNIKFRTKHLFDWHRLYERFIQTPNFTEWAKSRRLK